MQMRLCAACTTSMCVPSARGCPCRSITSALHSCGVQAQGLLQAMGGDAAQLAEMVQAHGVLLAAHGPYTAAGVADTLGLPVDCVSKDFSSFGGLVAALSQHFGRQRRGL